MNKLIKSIELNSGYVELRQVGEHYIVVSEDNMGIRYSSLISDFKLASYMFEAALEQISGH